ncbi:putative L-threonine 3-dehydrogenase [metagenome]|uniref:Putative L-threonine 3-dehydrogenase n=1 Tax=metagenome TaxID=256318 RepID=A0A2P2CA64_9ZZZZ
MNETSRAAVVAAYHQPFEVKNVPLPAPEPGAILVRIECATVCGSDVHIWQGGLEGGAVPVRPPLILGHEMVGRIVEFGDGPHLDSAGTELAVGDRIVWTHESCGHCDMCSVSGHPEMCRNRRVGMLRDCREFPYVTGSFAEHGYVWPRADRLRVPDDVKTEWASAASCAGRTVVNSIERAGVLDYRHTVVVQGSGPLGLFATAMLSRHGLRRLIVVGGPEQRLELARRWGADVTISVDQHSTPEARLAAVLEANDGKEVDVVFELAGAPTAFTEGVGMLGKAGRYVVTGTLTPTEQSVRVNRIVDRQLSILGAYSGVGDSYWKAMEFMRLNAKNFAWDDLFGERRYSLDEVGEAMARMRSFEEIKPVIVP